MEGLAHRRRGPEFLFPARALEVGASAVALCRYGLEPARYRCVNVNTRMPMQCIVRQFERTAAASWDEFYLNRRREGG